jgi:hypothetical protein
MLHCMLDRPATGGSSGGNDGGSRTPIDEALLLKLARHSSGC